MAEEPKKTPEELAELAAKRTTEVLEDDRSPEGRRDYVEGRGLNSDPNFVPDFKKPSEQESQE